MMYLGDRIEPRYPSEPTGEPCLRLPQLYYHGTTTPIVAEPGQQLRMKKRDWGRILAKFPGRFITQPYPWRPLWSLRVIIPER